MKIFIPVLALLLSLPLQADEDELILKFEKSSGFVPLEKYQTMDCRLVIPAKIGGKLLIQNRQIGTIKFSDSHFVSGSLDEMVKLIERASKGQVETNIGPVDGPTTRYTAYYRGTAHVLYSDGYSTNHNNLSPSAVNLRSVLDYLCEQKSIHTGNE